MNHYELPTPELLDSGHVNLSVSAEEVEQKKNVILHVFEDLGIEIFDVKETVGQAAFFMS